MNDSDEFVKINEELKENMEQLNLSFNLKIKQIESMNRVLEEKNSTIEYLKNLSSEKDLKINEKENLIKKLIFFCDEKENLIKENNKFYQNSLNEKKDTSNINSLNFHASYEQPSNESNLINDFISDLNKINEIISNSEINDLILNYRNKFNNTSSLSGMKLDFESQKKSPQSEKIQTFEKQIQTQKYIQNLV